MKTRSFFALVALAVVVFAVAGSGCSSTSLPSLPSSLRSTRHFENLSAPGEVRAVHQLCREVLESMGFKVVRSSWSDGTLEMNSRINPGDAAQLPRQRRVFVKVVKDVDGNSGVQIGFWEVSEDVAGGTTMTQTERLLKGGPLYDVFAQHLQEAVDAKAKEGEKPAAAASAPARPAAMAPTSGEPASGNAMQPEAVRRR